MNALRYTFKFARDKVDRTVQRLFSQARSAPYNQLTGTLTVLIPAAFSVLTSS